MCADGRSDSEGGEAEGEALVEAGGSRDAAELSAAPLVATVCLSLCPFGLRIRRWSTARR